MTRKKHFHLHIETAVDSWRRVHGLNARLQKAAVVTTTMLPEKFQKMAARSSATLLLTSDDAVRRLNHDFRGKNRPTNVLSFPAFTRQHLAGRARQKGVIYMGDIAISYRFTANEARKERKILKNHVTHLLIHGLLHLFGYNHDTNAAAAKMERLEKEIMAALKLPDPYEPID